MDFVCIIYVINLLSLWFECSVHASDGFPKKVSIGGGWVGRAVSSFFLICLTLQSLLSC